MDDKDKILELLEKSPAEAGEIAQNIGLRREQLVTLLMNMEKVALIVWDRNAWRLPESPKTESQGTKP